MAEPQESVLNEERNILIVSSNNEILTKLQQSLHMTWKDQIYERHYHLKVHVCPTLARVGDHFRKFDYIVYVIQPGFLNCLHEVTANLHYLGESFTRQKICLVAIGANYSAAVKPNELWDFACSYQFNMLLGCIQSADKAAHLSNRILNLSEACCGVINGIPLVGQV